MNYTVTVPLGAPNSIYLAWCIYLLANIKHIFVIILQIVVEISLISLLVKHCMTLHKSHRAVANGCHFMSNSGIYCTFPPLPTGRRRSRLVYYGKSQSKGSPRKISVQRFHLFLSQRVAVEIRVNEHVISDDGSIVI